ncbi:hypothetical protein SAMN05192558_106148 [Actinokineospora alba]|uniref:Uncharacterized protein n=1 Tax=Actinokineospora alba TaxID=504798 RepID=A0A1H0PKE9_9PSEU|nr:hypothetical protein [Actinokineospora alba]TDP65824.1 hypothetical protein C8E96_1315 [Actinokineospora alba]SDI64292.1 hypothetical protein SAMN05421871_106304 [Actinokineospora alba]SDP05135.1 hypothetical protein SAMN05192558_106148 [Actinokineospora alba]
MTLAHADTPPAGGAPVLQILIALGMFAAVFIPLTIFAVREVRGRKTALGGLADFAARITGLPRWAPLPMAVAFASGMSALIGVYWDVPIHMELGRDEGPLANPSHYPIYFGLVGIFASGIISAALSVRDMPPGGLKIGPNLRIPRGSVLMMATGSVGLMGFPLDDLWHRLFGQDVTEWGPTHVLMICGGIIVVIGIQLLLAEARRVTGDTKVTRWLGVITAGAWLMGTSAMLMEFDLGVPQFPMLAHVGLVALTTTWPMVVARASFGPGGALITVGVLIVSRLVFVAIPFAQDFHVAVLLPCIAEAIVIEIVALFLRPGYAFGAVSGLAVGTLGMLAETGLSQWIMPDPWPTSMLLDTMIVGVIAGVSGGLIGAWQHQRITEIAQPHTVVRPQGFRRRHALGLVGALGATAVLGFVVPPQDPDPGWTAEVQLTESPTGLHVERPDGAPERWVNATIKITPAEITKDAVWLNGFSWQGGGFNSAPLVPLGDGVYRTSEPLPVFGNWKSGIRLHTSDRVLTLAPVYAPADPAANAPAIAAVDGPHPFVKEIDFLQRERKSDTPPVLWSIAYLFVGGIFALAWALFAWLYASAAQPVRERTKAVA